METKVYNMHDEFDEDFWYVKVRNDLIEKTIPYYATDNLNIVDMGCGTGRQFDLLAIYGDVYCVDNNKKAIEACKKRGAEKLIFADVSDTKIKSKSIDYVVALDLIEHLDDDKGFLDEAYRILKPGGKLILTFPAFKSLWSVDDDMAHHKRRYTKKSFRNLVKSTDFKIKKLSYRYFFISIPSMFLFLLQKIKRKKVNSLNMSPRFLNRFLTAIGNFENSLITKNIGMPFGISIFSVLKK